MNVWENLVFTVDYFFWTCLSTSGRSKGVRWVASLFQAPRNLLAENWREKRARAGESDGKRSKVFPFPATTSSSDPTRRIFK